jgi:aminoglycoside phosphotransferase (APT) family kinase protein
VDAEMTTPLDSPEAIRSFLREHGVFDAEDAIDVTFLAGGVSSLVVRAESGGQSVVVKQALPRLKVQDEWLSRIERSLIEARCTKVLAELVPGSVPGLVAVDEDRHAFVMRCAPDAATTWKALLMAGTMSAHTAADAGRLLGRIHARSAGRRDLIRDFDDRSFFEELRLDPYLRTVARRHPDLADPIAELLDELLTRRICLVHGDYSPKNLLVLPDGGVVLLDHEVAHWGNPAFDTAFGLNHLCLKALKFPERAPAYVACARRFWDSYLAEEPPGRPEIAASTARVLGGLLLARVDGKSPVEYLVTEEERNHVRLLARDFVAKRVSKLDALLERVVRQAAHA